MYTCVCLPGDACRTGRWYLWDQLDWILENSCRFCWPDTLQRSRRLNLRGFYRGINTTKTRIIYQNGRRTEKIGTTTNGIRRSSFDSSIAWLDNRGRGGGRGSHTLLNYFLFVDYAIGNTRMEEQHRKFCSLLRIAAHCCHCWTVLVIAAHFKISSYFENESYWKAKSSSYCIVLYGLNTHIQANHTPLFVA